MKKVARFEKVSVNQFVGGCADLGYNEEEIKKMLEELALPKRATRGSTGYDFYAPFDIKLNPGETIKVPTGIRCYMEEDYVLKLYPRSGLGF